MAQMTPLAKGLATVVVIAIAVSAAWHLGLKEYISKTKGSSLEKILKPVVSTTGKGEVTVSALRLSGSNTIGSSLAPALAKGWLQSIGASDIIVEQLRDTAGNLKSETWVRSTLGGKPFDIEIISHGSGDAFKHLQNNRADIGMSSREIRPEEISGLSTLGNMKGRSSEHVIALDGIAIIVNHSNPLREISRRDLSRVFSGEIKNWSQLGGANAGISIYARDEKSGTFDTFKQLVLDGKALAPGARRFENSKELEASVAADPSGIGFTGIAYVKNTREVPVSDGAGTVALVPNIVTVKKEDYPLSRRLYLYTAAAPANSNVREFTAFALSPAGQAVVRGSRFIDLDINVKRAKESEGTANQNCRLSNRWKSDRDHYCRLKSGRTDLQTSFRFHSGSSELDNRAWVDLKRVLDAMAGHNPNAVVTLVGFADSMGDYNANLRLSVARANAVKKALNTLGLSRIEITGLGQEIPVADNETTEGREKNRRVEVLIGN